MEKLKNQQSICFKVTEKQGTNFLALSLSENRQKVYDNTLYTENVDLEIMPTGSPVRIIRGKNVFDSGSTYWYAPIPGEQAILMLGFKKLKGEDKLALRAKNLKKGDIVKIPWVLSGKEKKFLEQILGAEKTEIERQEEINRLFIARFGFGKEGVYINEPFTLFHQTIRP